jgi:hypothetical protein
MDNSLSGSWSRSTSRPAYRSYCVCVSSCPGSSLFEAHAVKPSNVLKIGLTFRRLYLMIGLGSTRTSAWLSQRQA